MTDTDLASQLERHPAVASRVRSMIAQAERAERDRQLDAERSEREARWRRDDLETERTMADFTGAMRRFRLAVSLGQVDPAKVAEVEASLARLREQATAALTEGDFSG